MKSELICYLFMSKVSFTPDQQSGISVHETYRLEPVLNHYRFTTPDCESMKK
jgi:hypothetical protein